MLKLEIGDNILIEDVNKVAEVIYIVHELDNSPAKAICIIREHKNRDTIRGKNTFKFATTEVIFDSYKISTSDAHEFEICIILQEVDLTTYLKDVFSKLVIGDFVKISGFNKVYTILLDGRSDAEGNAFLPVLLGNSIVFAGYDFVVTNISPSEHGKYIFLSRIYDVPSEKYISINIGDTTDDKSSNDVQFRGIEVAPSSGAQIIVELLAFVKDDMNESEE